MSGKHPTGAAAAASSSSVAVIDGFGDSFDPLNFVPPADPSVSSSSSPSPLASRVQKVPRKKGPKVSERAVDDQSQENSVAPWLHSDEADERERREEMRKALRDKIRSKRNGRTRSGGKAADDGADESEPNPLSQLQGMDFGMIQQLAAKMGIPADQLPSKRQLMRKLNGKNLDDLVAKAKAKGTS